MNKGLATIIRDRLKDIPFIDLFGGLVYVQKKKEVVFRDDDDIVGAAIEHRFPVSCDVFGQTECDGSGLQDFIPNGKRKGMLYIEDLGVSPLASPGEIQKYESRLRVVVWLNTRNIGLPPCNLSTPVMAGIIERLRGNPFNAGDYQRVFIKVANIPKLGAEIFNQYTYDETRTQYLMPPYEYFAIDLSVTFDINPACLRYIMTKTPDPCSN